MNNLRKDKMVCFCKKCGSLLIPEKQKEKKILICKNCNYFQESEKNLVLHEKIKKPADKKLEILDDGNLFATYDYECENCGHQKSEVIIIGPSYSDEDTIIRFRCGKCGHTKSAGKRFK